VHRHPRDAADRSRGTAARIAKDLDAAQEDETVDAGARRRLGETLRALGIDAHEGRGIGRGVADMDMGGEMDDLIDVAQCRRPLGVRADLADDANLRPFRRRAIRGTTLRQDEAVAQQQQREKRAPDKTAGAGDENTAHPPIIGRPDATA
jgi:hypothetical protein